MTPTIRTIPRTVSRRSVLGGSAVAVAGAAAAVVAPRFAFATPESPTTSDVIVLVFLRGGADGLNLVAPHRMPTYRALRPTIRVKSPEEFTTPAGKAGIPLVAGGAVAPFALSDVFAFCPGMDALASGPWAAGKLAIVHAVGMPASESPIRSHFEAQRNWECGSASLAFNSGWLNRYLGAVGATTRVPAIAHGINMPRVLGGDSLSLTMESVENFGVDGFIDLEAATTALQQLHGSATHEPITRTGGVALDAINIVESVNWAGITPRPGVSYGNDVVGRQLADVAALIKGNIGLRVAQIDMGLWDHHINTGTPEMTDCWLRQQATMLSNGLAAFSADMGSRMDEVTLVVASEFGRTIDQNGSGGTDHGRGGMMMVMGNHVRGGIHGPFPGQIEHGPEGDLAVLTDYRSVLAEVFAKRGGLDSMASVFPTWQPASELGVCTA